MHMIVRTALAAGFVACTLGGPAAQADDAVKLTVLSELDRFEPWEGHAFHAGHLWVGRSRQDMAAFYRLEVYTPDGKLMLVKELAHSLRMIYPYGSASVIVVGLGTDQLSHYTIATLTAGRVDLSHTTIPLGALADKWAGVPGRHFFSDPGGFDDPEHPTPIGQPLQTLFAFDRSRTNWLKPRIAAPSLLAFARESLYIVSAPTFLTGGKTLTKMNTATQTTTILLQGRNDLRSILVLPKLNLMAMAESGAAQTLIIDLKTDAVVQTFPSPAGRPRALAAFGKCLAVATEDTRQVQFFDLTESARGPLAVWDLAPAGAHLYGIRSLAADPVSGRIYARSAYACNPTSACSAERNSVVMASPEGTSLAVTKCLGG